MPATANDRKRHEALQGRLRELRSQEVDLQKEAAATAIGADGGFNQDAPSVRALQAARAEIKNLEELAQRSLEHFSGMIGSPRDENLLDDQHTVQELEQLAFDPSPIGNKLLGTIVGRDSLVDGLRSGRFEPGVQAAASVGGIADIGNQSDPSRTGLYRGIIPQIRRRLQVLATIPVATMDAGSFWYSQESGVLDEAAEVAEGATSPPASVTFTDVECVARTVAAWMKSNRQSLADLPQLQLSLESRLMYSVSRRIESAIISGDGVGENLRGILNTTGIGSVAYSAGEPLSDLTLDAITAVLLSESVPDLALFNPVDLQTMQKAKAAGSGERLDSEGAFAATSNTIWDLPRVGSTAIPVGTALVGDFSQGATLMVRDGVQIRISDSDQDDFLKQRMSILASARVGLVVWRPMCFAEVHLA